ncbi:MAG: bis(5'-nucleosyl)-tetraphosphatase (symmetrical) YqeK [Clostridia bacterium]|nr:bis(5'-nucleosyl)-tetraphosphatase (symmetrical) YqeK [Clostridia bacterium]
MIRADDILSALEVSEKRFRHTLGVAECAKKLARTHFPALDIKEVELAALMHDFTKEYSIERQYELCRYYGITLSEDERLEPKLIHSKTAAAIADERFGLSKEACSAIYWHTTGRAAMTGFETVIYLADYIEEYREDAACVRLREFYEKRIAKEKDPYAALVKTLVKSFDATIKYLLESGKTICGPTVTARNYYIRALNALQNENGVNK